MGEAETVLSDLFWRYAEHPDDLPADWSHGSEVSDGAGGLRRIGDFIAGMTDRYALIEHARLFKSTPELR
jgi:dGTPase